MEAKKEKNSLGRHFLVELYDCDANILNDVAAARNILLEAARVSGATIIDDTFHEFSPQGVSGVVVIAESHISVHTWPEYRYAALDIFTCGTKMRPELAVEHLAGAFRAEAREVEEMQRGIIKVSHAEKRSFG